MEIQITSASPSRVITGAWPEVRVSLLVRKESVITASETPAGYRCAAHSCYLCSKLQVRYCK